MMKYLSKPIKLNFRFIKFFEVLSLEEKNRFIFSEKKTKDFNEMVLAK